MAAKRTVEGAVSPTNTITPITDIAQSVSCWSTSGRKLVSRNAFRGLSERLSVRMNECAQKSRRRHRRPVQHR
jgi:ribosomal protein S11